MGKGLLKAAGFIALITILSKLIGFSRDLVIANCYGASTVSDAFFYAYQIPSFFLILLGGLNGPFHTATVAYFTKIKAEQNLSEEEVNKLLNKFITFTFLIALLLAVLVYIFADSLSHLLIYSGSNELKQLVVLQLKWMTPIVIIGSLVGIFYGLLSMHGEFLSPSLSPVIISITVIIAVVGWGDSYGGICLAIGSLIGALLQLIMQFPGYTKFKYRFYPVLSTGALNVKGLSEFLFPAMIGTTIGQINVFVDMFFVSGLEDGSWTAIGYANRLIQLVLGVLLTALLVPIFPVFTQFVTEKRFEDLKYYFTLSLKIIWFIAFPITSFILIFGHDGIAVLLERGSFDRQDTVMVTTAMFYLSFSIIPYLARDVITRLFYAYNDSKTPLYAGIAAIIINVLADWILVKFLGIGGITLSTTLVTLFSLSLLSIIILKHNPDLNILQLWKSFLILLLAAGAAGFITYLFKSSINVYPADNIWIQICLLAVFFVMNVLIFIGLVFSADNDYKEIFYKVFIRLRRS